MYFPPFVNRIRPIDPVARAFLPDPVNTAGGAPLVHDRETGLHQKTPAPDHGGDCPALGGAGGDAEQDLLRADQASRRGAHGPAGPESPCAHPLPAGRRPAPGVLHQPQRKRRPHPALRRGDPPAHAPAGAGAPQQACDGDHGRAAGRPCALPGRRQTLPSSCRTEAWSPSIPPGLSCSAGGSALSPARDMPSFFSTARLFSAASTGATAPPSWWPPMWTSRPSPSGTGTAWSISARLSAKPSTAGGSSGRTVPPPPPSSLFIY